MRDAVLPDGQIHPLSREMRVSDNMSHQVFQRDPFEPIFEMILMFPVNTALIGQDKHRKTNMQS